MDKVTVIQADREAAADCLWPLARSGESIPAVQEWHAVRNGDDDGHHLVVAFAKHREASATPAPDSGERMREALEPFAGVAVGEVWKHFSAENPTLRISSSDGSRHLTFVSAEWFERARAALQESAR